MPYDKAPFFNGMPVFFESSNSRFQRIVFDLLCFNCAHLIQGHLMSFFWLFDAFLCMNISLLYSHASEFLTASSVVFMDSFVHMIVCVWFLHLSILMTQYCFSSTGTLLLDQFCRSESPLSPKCPRGWLLDFINFATNVSQQIKTKGINVVSLCLLVL